ncbi:MAG: DUF3553 domain-containing protein [Pseudomonadota bacterium]
MTRSQPKRLWFQPGDWVLLRGHEDWGQGQVQSVVGTRVTINFEDAGKQVINLEHAELAPVL